MTYKHKSELHPNPFIDSFYGKFSLQKREDLELLKNITENGIVTPIIISQSGLIISGNRRYYCAIQLATIQKVPVVVQDIKDSEITEFLIISLQQFRTKTIIQLAKEYKLIGDHYEVRRGKGNESKNSIGKELRRKILKKRTSRSTIERVINSLDLIIELEGISEEKAWEKLNILHETKKKKPATILKQLESIRDERENTARSKKLQKTDYEEFRIFTRSCEDLSDIVTDNSISCVTTSPPYYSGIRRYSEDGKEVKNKEVKNDLEQLGHEKTPEEYIEKMVRYISECSRTLRTDGSIWINVMDVRKGGNYFNVPEKLLIEIERLGLKTAQKCIWFKNNPPYDDNSVFQPSMEHIFHFVKDTKKYKWKDNWYSEADEFLGQITYGDASKKRKFRNVFFYPSNKTERNQNDGVGFVNSMLQTNVINNSYLKGLLNSKGLTLQHNALYDLEVPMICILSTTDKNDNVMDIFSGLATTGLIAYANGCNYIGIELSSVYKTKSIIRFEDFLEKNPNISWTCEK